MLKKKEQSTIIKNLRDAGCDEEFIEEFLICYEKKETNAQINLLNTWRRNLLDQIHIGEKQISCLDFLIYQIQKEII